MKVFWLCLLWAFTTNACWAESFNIWGGSPIGGFGDVATNLLLAQQLKEVRPKADITIVYSEEAGSEYLVKLIPGFESSAKPQSFGGIRFVRSDTPIPRADYFFEFSAKNGKYDDLAPVPEKIAASGKVLMRFSELGTNEHTDPTQKNTSAVSPLIANDSTASQIRLRLLTGPAVNEAGLYLSSSKPSARLTRPELFQKLSALDKSGNPVPAESVLAFVYSDRQPTSDSYAKALANLATKKTFGDRPVVLVSNYPPPRDVRRTAGIIHVTVANMPFALTKEILNHVDLPVAITGSVSLSLAIDSETPFLYETLRWKKELTNNLISLLTAPPFSLNAKKTLGALRAFQPNDAKETGNDFKQLSVKQIETFLQDTEFTAAFKASLNGLRASHSLVRNLDKFLTVLPQIDVGSLTPPELEATFHAAAEGLTGSEIKERLAKPLSAAKRPLLVLKERPEKKLSLPQQLLVGSAEAAVDHILDLAPPKRRLLLEQLQELSAPDQVDKVIEIHRQLYARKDPLLTRQLSTFAYCRINWARLAPHATD